MITTENKSQSFMRIAVKLFVVLFLVFVLLSWIGAPVMAQTTTLTTTNKDLFNGEYELYKVPKGQTLSGVAVKFNTSMDVIKLLNPGLETKGLQADAFIKVPKAGSTVKTTSTTNTNTSSTTSSPIYHTVTSGETLYALSKQFNVTVTQIKSWNNMSSDNLQSGAKVIVGYNGKAPDVKPSTTTSTTTVPTTTTVVNSTTNNSTSSNSSTVVTNTTSSPTTTTPTVTPKPTSNSKKLSVNETGMASFTSSSEKLLLALHPTAPVGTYITVKNPANDKSIQVKVIGRLPENEANENVSIQLSTFAASQLGITDQLSTVQLSYLTAMQ